MERDFTIHCRMKERWIASFIKMLDSMSYCGSIGHSEFVGLYADGDGDFQPKFTYDKVLASIGDEPKIIKNPSGQMTMFDAG